MSTGSEHIHPDLEHHEIKTIPTVEVFGPTIQGEGALTGVVTHFIRLGGCTYRCSWCDSMHAVDPELIKRYAERLTPMGIVNRIQGLAGAAKWITISGGDPVIHDLGVLVRALRIRDYRVAVETQGKLYKHWLTAADYVTVSPKPPSSGMASQLDEIILREYDRHLSGERQWSFKVVVFDRADFMWAMRLHRVFKHVPFYISVGTPRPDMTPGSHDPDVVALEVLERYREIIKLAHEMGAADIAITPQMHVLLWGHKQGV
jgi:7-carboxy-7-deazaguanine synthase